MAEVGPAPSRTAPRLAWILWGACAVLGAAASLGVGALTTRLAPVREGAPFWLLFLRFEAYGPALILFGVFLLASLIALLARRWRGPLLALCAVATFAQALICGIEAAWAAGLIPASPSLEGWPQ